MKALFFTAALAASLISTQSFADADPAAGAAAKAKEAFAKRDYTNAGIHSAQQAADLYAEAAKLSTGAAQANYLIQEAGAIYFVGEASTNNDVKIEKHLKGIQLTDQALKNLGIDNVPGITDAQIAQLKSAKSKDELSLIAEGLYYRGTNLGQWGQANGVVQSLSKWPELRRTMETIQALGLVATHDFGAFRVLGRGYFKIPRLLGGDMGKATFYLKTAFEKTKAKINNVTQEFSRNGYNNNYYAEVLKENNEAAKGKELLQKFIAADPKAIDSENEVELKHAQEQAKELLKSF